MRTDVVVRVSPRRVERAEADSAAVAEHAPPLQLLLSKDEPPTHPQAEGCGGGGNSNSRILSERLFCGIIPNHRNSH
jgi:hypothetical protein